MAKSNINDILFDEVMKHATYVESYKSSEIKMILEILLDKEQAVRKLLIDEYGGKTKRQQELFIKKIQSVYDEFYDELLDRFGSDVEEFADSEDDIQHDIVVGALPSVLDVSKPTDKAYYVSAPQDYQNQIILGFALSSWISNLKSADWNRFSAAIRQSYQNGNDVTSLLRTITGTRAAKYKNGLENITRNQAAALARTTIQAVAEEAQKRLIAVNSQLFDGLLYVAVLDNRTTPVCRSRSGRIYSPEKAPRIPAHVGCRSHYSYVLKSFNDLGVSADDVEGLTVGSTTKYETFGDWLQTQGNEVQDSILGQKRGKLFRDGGLSDPLKTFYSEAEKKQLTLNQLRDLYPEAFKKAGLE